MANKGNPSRQPMWLVLLALCLFTSGAFDFTSLIDTDVLQAEAQARLEHPDRPGENNANDTGLADAGNYCLSAGLRLSDHSVNPALLATSDAYPPDTIHGPPLAHITTV